MTQRPWFTPALVTVLGVLMTTVSLLLLAIRAHDVGKIEWLIDQNAAQEGRIWTLEAREQAMIHELDRVRDRLERLEGRR